MNRAYQTARLGAGQGLHRLLGRLPDLFEEGDVLQYEAYDPFADLMSRVELTVGVTELPVGDAWWVQDERAILLDSRLDDVQRRCMSAHMAAHLDLDHCPIPAADLGRLRAREHEAQHLAASRLVPVDQLLQVVDRVGTRFEDIALALRVTPATLRVRLRTFPSGDRRRWVDANQQIECLPHRVPALRCSLTASLFTAETAEVPALSA